MSGIRIGIRGGGANIPPEKRRIDLSTKCKKSVEHTKKVAEQASLTRFEGVPLKITEKPPGAGKVHNLLFKP